MQIRRSRACSHLKRVSLLISINLETTMSKYFTKQDIILYLCNDNDNEIILFGHREKTVKC